MVSEALLEDQVTLGGEPPVSIENRRDPKEPLYRYAF